MTADHYSASRTGAEASREAAASRRPSRWFPTSRFLSRQNSTLDELDRDDGNLDSQFVRFVNVQKSFDGEVFVLKSICLDVRRGEFLTFLGPSGSGKTTALMLLAGFEVPTGGEIRMAGRSLSNMPPNRRDIGMVFQSYALFPHKTVFENLAFPLVARRRPKEEIVRRVGHALEMVHLSGFERRRPGQLSGGQQQRVALARALIFEPKLILMDEPLSALDRQLRERMQFEIKRIHESIGITMIYVTHDQSEALIMSDRIAVFNEGRIEQLASPQQLYREPSSVFVAGFIGENNLLSGRLVEVDGEFCTVEVADGVRICALAVNCGPIGARADVSIRAEDIKIDPPDGGEWNRFAVRVVEVIFLGDHARLRVALAERDDIIIKVPADSGAASSRLNDVIPVGWDRRNSRALTSAD